MWKIIKLKISVLVDLLKTIYNDIFRIESDQYKPYTTNVFGTQIKEKR
jgi:hypothetical protein